MRRALRLAALAAGLLTAPALAGCLADDALGPDAAALETSAFALLGGLEPGGTLTLEGAQAGRLPLPGGAAGAQYVLVPFHAADQGTARLQVEVALEPGAGAAPAASAAAVGAADVAGPPTAGAPYGDDAAHRTLRRWQREQLGTRLAAPGWAEARRHLLRAHAARRQDVPAVGDLVPLRIIRADPANSNLCETWAPRTGRVLAVSEHAVMVVDTQNPPGGLDAVQLRELADEFDQRIRPTGVAHFGEPTDIDGNGRVLVVFSTMVNQLGAAGLFFTGDLLPRTESSSLPPNPVFARFACPASNEAEVLYLLAPDPAGTAGFPVSQERAASLAASVAAHELQHLINHSRRLYRIPGATQLEEVWLDEGLSHIAEELAFYDAAGLRPGGNLSRAELDASPDVRAAFRRYGEQNLLRLVQYVDRPQRESLLGLDTRATRGATWAFLRYAADHRGGGDAAFFRALVNSGLQGVANLDHALAGDALDLMQTWTASVFTDDHVPVRSALLTQPSWNFRSLLPGYHAHGAFPLPLRSLNAAGREQFSLRGGGAGFLHLSVAPGAHARVTVTSGGAQPPEPLRVTVVRVK